MTLSGHRCHFCPSSGTDPRGTPLPVPSQQPSSLLLIFLQLHVSGACTASRTTITAFAKRSRPRWAQPQQRLLTAVCGKGAVCTRTAGFLISPSGDTFPCSRHLAHPLLSCQVLWWMGAVLSKSAKDTCGASFLPYIWLSYSLDPSMSVHPARTGGPVQASQCLYGEAHSETSSRKAALLPDILHTGSALLWTVQ